MSQQPHWHHRHGDRYSQNVTTATGQTPQQQPQPSPGQAKMSDPTRFQGEPDQPERPGSRQSRQMERSHTYSENLSQSRSDYDSYYGNQASYRSDGRYRARDYDGHYGYGYYDYQRDPYYDSYYGQDPHRQRLLRGYYEEMQYYNQHYDSRHHHDDRYRDYYNRQLTGGYDDVDRHSSHSRSSSRGPSIDGNEETGADNFAREFHGQSSRPSSRTDYEQPGGYPNNQYDQSYGHGYDYSSYDYNNGYSHPYQEAPPERRTPVQFSIPHVRVSFGPGGQLAKVVPNQPVSGQPALVEIHDIETLIPPSPETEALRQFPGPLVKGETHKNDVLAFCHHMMRACRDDVTLTDRESAVLCWKLLELLIKQNGTVVGTDIAELLLDGSSVTSTEECVAQKDIHISARASDEELSHTDSANCVTTSDRTEINKDSLSIEEVTDRFRNLLLYGRKKDALEWAMKNSLWGHALFLASKLDNRTHASVMARFASISMRMNDPLQTLYQLMSSRQPAAVTCISDERWGDWRPHLAMVLSNHSNKAELDKKSIIQLGDTLASRRCLYASHFCYLMAQCTFGIYSKKTSKIVLIGSNNTLPWELFANNRAIQCTEVYEYTQSLGNPLFSSPNFQLYKFIYATRLAQCGMLEQALHYCEVIANTVLQNPVQYQPILFKQLYQLGNRLKYSDPQLQHRGDDQSDPYWLQQLLQVCQRFDDSTLTAQPLSGGETPVGFGSTAVGSDWGDGVATATEMTTAQYQSTFQGQTTAHLDQTDGQTVDQAQPQQTETTDQSQQVFSTDQYNSQLTGQQNAAYGQDRQQARTQDQSALYNSAYGTYAGYAQNSSYVNYAQPAQNATNQQPAEGGVTQQLAPENSTNQHTFPPQQQRLLQQQQYNTDQQQQLSQQQQKVNTNYNISNFQQFAKKFPNSGDQGTSVTSVNSTSTETSGSTEIESAANTRPFDYFASSTQQQSKVVPPMSKTVETQPAAQSRPETKLSQDTDGNKDSNDKKPKQNSGFFGGMFNKSWFQGKNDDQNPAITSDPVAGKQMNSEPDKGNSKPAPPPPKHNELVGAHGKYADALNPGGMGSSATAPSSLFAAMPSNTPAPQNIFTPIIAGGDSQEPVNQSEDNKIAAAEPQTESASQSQQPFQTPQQPPSQQSIQQQSYESNQQQSYQQNHNQTSQQQSYQQNKQQTYQQQTYQQNQQPITQQHKQQTYQQQTYQQIQQPTSQHQVTYQQNQPQVHQQNQQQNYQDNQQQNYYHNQHAQQMQGPATYLTQQTVQQQTQANEQKISGEEKSAPPPAMPQMPVMFNPAQFLSQQQITASTASSQPVRGLRYGQRRVYPK